MNTDNSSTPLNVLIIDDSPNDVVLILRHLSSSGWNPHHLRVETVQALDAAFADQQWDIVLSDYSMPKLSVEQALQRVRLHDSNLPVIVVTGAMQEDELIRLIKLGARDFILKDRLSRLKPAIERELGEARQRQEQANAESRFLNALDHISEGIALYDPNDRLVLCNERYREILHPVRNSIVPGVTFEKLVEEAVRAGHFAGAESNPGDMIEHHLSRHRNPEQSFEQQLANERWLRIQEDRTAEGGIISILTDITERKKINIMKNEFIAVVSHELRTPLTAIRGAIALLNLKLRNDPELGKLADLGLRNSDRLLHLVDDILNMEKLKAGKMEICLKRLSAWDPIVQAAETSLSFAEQFGVNIVTRPPDSDLWIFADSEKLIQVLINLLSNAAKFSPKGGNITIGANLCGDIVQFYVSDEGPGIPDAYHGMIFDKFTQIDSSDTRRRGGVGLGLSISKQIVDALGGEIHFETAPGAGTTFFVELPAATANTAVENVTELHDSVQQERQAS